MSDYRTVIIEKVRYAVAREFRIRLKLDSSAIADDVAVDAEIEREVLDHGTLLRMIDLVATLRVDRRVAALKGEKIYKRASAQVPDGRWSALRAALGWAWLVRRWPPRMREIVVEVEVPQYLTVCPHVRLDDDREHLEYLAQPPGDQ